MSLGGLMLVDTDETFPTDVHETRDVSRVVSAEETFEPSSTVIKFAPKRAALPAPRLDYAVWRLGAHELTRPILVTLEEDNGDVVASNNELRLWGVGANKFQAQNDLALTFMAVLDSYSATPAAELSGDGAAYLHKLRSLIG